MSDEAALLRAITADADEDTPRLAYADWLDENEGPLQAEFIRLQCRLAGGSAAAPDYPDLLERYADVAVRFALAVKLTAPPLPPGFVHRSGIEPGANHFRRGFLHTAFGEWGDVPMHNWAPPPSGEQLDRACAGLAALVAGTTVRHLVLHAMTPDRLTRLLVAPGARALTGLTIYPIEPGPAAGNALIGALTRSDAVANLERLALPGDASAAGLSALGAAPMPRLRSFSFPALSGRAGAVAALTRAGWFRGLREVSVGTVTRAQREPLTAALAGLPHLDSLNLILGDRAAMKGLGTAAGFPALARLSIHSWVETDRVAARLARGRFPRLAELTVSHLRDEWFAALLGARWLPQVRVLDVSNGALTDASAVALAKSAAAPALRALRIGSNRLTKAGLAALGDGGRFPHLTTLDLGTGRTQVRAATAVRFAAALSLPRVRHLDLGGWPLGDAGAAALAANPGLAGVTRLALPNCRIGERGLTALARSPHLQQLVELDLGNNNLKRAAALLDPAPLPRLAAAGLGGNPIPPAARERLRRARGWLV